jgi:hypothetical protein
MIVRTILICALRLCLGVPVTINLNVRVCALASPKWDKRTK